MATSTPRVWFKNISLENVRSFGTKQTINFTDKAGNAARWNVILGDNGTGKTTVLKGLCEIVDGWPSLYDHLRYGTERGEIRVIKVKEGVEGGQCFEVMRPKIYPINVIVAEGSYLPIREHFDEKPFLSAYGASRKIGTQGISTEPGSRIQNLFDENASLVNAEELLIQADYTALKQGDDASSAFYTKIKTVLLRLFRQEVSDIYISTNTGTPKVFFKTHYGDVRLHELSLGYKTLIAWMVDFAKGLLDRYPDSPDPLAEPAVCLVDELDLHLHPRFQREIIGFLTETFPNTQFIVTAHSPLIVQTAEDFDANVILLKRVGNETHVVNDPVDVRNWRLDQILTSELFGLDSGRAKKVTDSRNERDALLAKKRPTKADRERLTTLEQQIGFLPHGDDQAEIQAETIIHQLADALRNRVK
jgi:hypothetical protein